MSDRVLPYEALTYSIIGAFFEVYNTLGFGFLEKVYENALCIALKERGITFAQQSPLEVKFHEQIVGLYMANLFVENVILIEIKACDDTYDAHPPS